MRNRVIIFAVLLATSLAAFASKEESLQQLIARAEAARLEDRPPLYAEIAERQLKSADQLYAAGKVEDATAAVNGVVIYCDKATNAATKSGKKLKNTEIAVRKMAAKLRDIRRSLAFEDQGPVKAAADRLESMRTELLSRMFGGKDKK